MMAQSKRQVALSTGMRQSMRRKKQDTRNIILAAVSGTALSALGVWLWRRHYVPLQEQTLDLNVTTPSPHVLDDSVYEGERTPQFIQEGTGPLFHRRYYADIAHPTLGREELMQKVMNDLNTMSPGEMMYFERISGTKGEIKVGDEFYIHIAGPWDGPVRVIEVMPTSFSFITLEDHFEAGEIQFRVIDSPPEVDGYRFEIRSWARSRTALVSFLYNILPFVRVAQTRVWAFFCHQAVELSGGEMVGDMQVMTHRVPYRPAQAKPVSTPKDEPPAWKQYSPYFERYRAAKLNFDLDKREDYTEKYGWRIDKYAVDLPKETCGAPQTRGSFELAKEVLRNYEFPDPSLISGLFVPDEPLEERLMVLRAHFFMFTFFFGVKIGAVVDEKRTDEKRGEAQVWGYSYRTLEGHFEMGEITFEIWKYLASGAVEFRIHAYSKRTLIQNPFYRIGFSLFGRSLQLRFARSAMDRMQKIVISRLTNTKDETEKTEVQTTSEEPAAQEKIKEVKSEDTVPPNS